MTSTLSPARLRLVTVVLAVGCGLTVANLYYGQPLLPEIAQTYGVGQGAASIVVTATQIGYVFGLLLLLPLGDLVENRRLVGIVLLGTTAALVATALAPTFSLFLALSALVGITSVVAQILVPFAAHLAPDDSRGRLVGTVMSGLLVGILLARSVSSFVAAAFGWRAIYLISAVLMVVLLLVVHRLLPVRRPEPGANYGRLLLSIGELVRTEPVLRRRALAQAGMFGAFSVFWTAISYQLVRAHGFTQAGIGIFALVGAAGALAAPIAGRVADRGHGRVGRIAMAAMGSAAMVLAAFGGGSVVVLAAGGVLMDFAVQAHQVMSQRDIYALRADARARINTVFMTTVFAIGAFASALTGALTASLGWTGIALVGAVFPLIALALALIPVRR